MPNDQIQIHIERNENNMITKNMLSDLAYWLDKHKNEQIFVLTIRSTEMQREKNIQQRHCECQFVIYD